MRIEFLLIQRYTSPYTYELVEFPLFFVQTSARERNVICSFSFFLSFPSPSEGNGKGSIFLQYERLVYFCNKHSENENTKRCHRQEKRPTICRASAVLSKRPSIDTLDSVLAKRHLSTTVKIKPRFAKHIRISIIGVLETSVRVIARCTRIFRKQTLEVSICSYGHRHLEKEHSYGCP